MMPMIVHDITLAAMLLATFTPLAAFALILIFIRQRPRLSAGISIGAITISLLSSLFLLVRHWHLDAPVQYAMDWLITGKMILPAGFLLDPLSLLMLNIVVVICFLVQVYSLGYMAGDPGFARYYAFMSLFAWAMLSLCLSHGLVQLYVFWELVGLSSYLLIGFWFEKFSASEAGKKAFVMTRLGDVSFLLGILVVLGHLGDLSILKLNAPSAAASFSPSVLTLAVLLIFGGIVGKSAQFPLLTWLPDAMEGPTPVSALLHSATMVAAGVFLFARLFPFFSQSPTAMTVCLAVGTISMLLASTMAMVTRDIKQVWAYSTISQLGFMIMGLGAGGYFAGVFHLTTHAGFKALLFLCSGVFIHAFHSNDMFDIGRAGGRGLKVPMICIFIAAAALAGLPPLSGFFSKEAILGVLAEKPNPVWLVAGLAGAFLTAYYTFRLIFIILFPKKDDATESPGDLPASDHDPGEAHHTNSYWVMAVPLLILAAVSLVLGFFQDSFLHFLVGGAGADHGGDHAQWLLYVAVGSALAGVVLAWLEFGRAGAAQIGFVERVPSLAALFAERWYLDSFYRIFLDKVVYGIFSNLCAKNDKVIIDGGVDGLGRSVVKAGGILSVLHSGMIQYRLLVMFLVVVLLGLYFFF
jgi:NADH-quinone oxidoreductase subunit L